MWVSLCNLLTHLFVIRLDKLFSKRKHLHKKEDPKKTDESSTDVEEPDMFVERIRLERMELRCLNWIWSRWLAIRRSFFIGLFVNLTFKLQLQLFYCCCCYNFDSMKNLLGKLTIQEPTFDRMIVVYRFVLVILLCFS
jgi:hypothetical protein